MGECWRVTLVGSLALQSRIPQRMIKESVVNDPSAAYTQWAAVMTHLSASKTPPQK